MPRSGTTTAYPRFLTLPEHQRPALMRGTLLKTHQGTVSFPDSTEGAFSYERLGPACHRFHYRYHDGTALPRQYLTEPLGNDPRTIERKAQEIATRAFEEAMEAERRNRFLRVSMEADEKRQVHLYQVSAGVAKDTAGRYALCMRIGSRFVRVTGTFKEYARAAEEWKQRRNPALVVCCMHRRHRRWERPKFDLLRAEEGYGKEDLQTCQGC